MEGKFSVSEIVEMGVQIEKNGEAFYEALAGRADRDNVKDLYAYLAEAERKHVENFRKVLVSVENYQPDEAYPQEYFEYMRSLAEGHVFTRKDIGRSLAEKVNDVNDGLDMALDFERKSIEFFQGAKKILPAEDHPVMDMLVSQEREHIEKLNQIRKTLT